MYNFGYVKYFIINMYNFQILFIFDLKIFLEIAFWKIKLTGRNFDNYNFKMISTHCEIGAPPTQFVGMWTNTICGQYKICLIFYDSAFKL
jgi:hypothetical protein